METSRHCSSEAGETVPDRCPVSAGYPACVVLRINHLQAVAVLPCRNPAIRAALANRLRAVALDTGIFVDVNPGDNAWAAQKAGSH